MVGLIIDAVGCFHDQVHSLYLSAQSVAGKLGVFLVPRLQYPFKPTDAARRVAVGL
jgi:hypothetical protein